MNSPRRLGTGSRAFTLLELMICIAILMFVGIVAIGSGANAREYAYRAKCASNLKQIGLALRIYETQFQTFPRTSASRAGGDSPYKVTWGTGAPADAKNGSKDADPFSRDRQGHAKPGSLAPDDNDITASLYLLLRSEDMRTAVFVCPSSTTQEPWDFGGGTNRSDFWTNWPGKEGLAKHLSYSFQNMFPDANAVANGWAWTSSKLTSEYALVSDMNPGGDALLALQLNSPAKEMRAGNSFNHKREGQNVLFGDCHVEWESTPFCGVKRDNLFTANGPELAERKNAKAVFLASPVDDTDSILLPTAADLGIEAPTPMKPKTDSRPAAELQNIIVGQYTQTNPGPNNKPLKGVLTIDDSHIVERIGPIVITYDYTVKGETDNGAVIVGLTAHDIDPAQATLKKADDGSIEIDTEDEIGFFNGTWKKE